MAWTKIKIGIAISMLAVSGFLFWQNRGLIEEKAQQAFVIVQQQAELMDKDQRIEDLARQREAERQVAAREKARAIEIRHESRRLRDEVERLERESEAVRDWAGTHLPDNIYDILRQAADSHPD